VKRVEKWKKWREDRNFRNALRIGLRNLLNTERGSITVASYLISEESRKLSQLTIILLIETAVLIVLTAILARLTWHLAFP